MDQHEAVRILCGMASCTLLGVSYYVTWLIFRTNHVDAIPAMTYIFFYLIIKAKEK